MRHLEVGGNSTPTKEFYPNTKRTHLPPKRSPSAKGFVSHLKGRFQLRDSSPITEGLRPKTKDLSSMKRLTKDHMTDPEKALDTTIQRLSSS